MLRLEIDGRWEPEDFIEVLTAVESLYYKAALHRRPYYGPDFYWFERHFLAASFEEQLKSINDWMMTRARTIARSDYRLSVARISYASPGGIDLVGLGDACKALEGIIDRLIKLVTERKLRREADNQAQIATAIKQTELDVESERVVHGS
jgi:hypothetical protein